MLGVTLAGLLATWRFLRTREIQEVRARYLTNGISRLKANVGDLIQISAINYQIALELWRTLREFSHDSLLRPRPEDLPELIPVERSMWLFEPLAIAQELLGQEPIGAWCAHLFTDANIAYREYLSQVRQPLARYYDSAQRPSNPQERFRDDRTKTVEDVRSRIESLNQRATRHTTLYNVLHDIELRLLQRGISRHSQVPKFKEDGRVAELLSYLNGEYRPIKEEFEERMRTAGIKSGPD